MCRSCRSARTSSMRIISPSGSRTYRIGMRASLDPAGVPEEGGCEREARRFASPTPGGPMQEIGVCRRIRERGGEEPLGLQLLRH